MKSFVDSLRHLLRADPEIVARVGTDDDDEIKVYQGVGKTDVDAPYIVFGIIDGTSVPTFGQDHTVQEVNFQVTAWGRTSSEAWNLAEVIDDALEVGDWDVVPYEPISLRRIQFPQELPDRDTQLRQVPIQYRFVMAK